MRSAGPSGPATTRTVYRTCPICEATCGLELVLRDRVITRVRGDRDDVFSHGYLCPKGAALRQLEADPDRITAPQVRHGEEWRTVSWEDAFAEIERRLTPILREGDPDALAIYVGNANHSLDTLYLGVLLEAAGTVNIYTAGTADQIPKQLACGLVFGHPNTVPVPDIDRCSYLLMLGANPFASNGSLFTAPGIKDRIAALQGRGGRVVAVDPRRTPTAAVADEHVAIRPGTDALFLFAVVHEIFASGLVDLAHLGPHVNGVEEIGRLASGFSPDAVAARCGVPAATIRRLARELATAPSAAVYGRLGTSAQVFGTLASWLVDVCNVITGNLDRPGGAMFPKAVAGQANSTAMPGRPPAALWGRPSRVRGLRQVNCLFPELPLICLPDEIETPGPGQVRALFTIGGNPVLSNPNSARLEAALGRLDLLVSVDIYRSETSRHADVILPAPSDLVRPHYDVFFYQLACRNVANYSPPSVPCAPGERREWETFARLAAIVSGRGVDIDLVAFDDEVARKHVTGLVGLPGSIVEGRDPAELLDALAPRRGPERLLDLLVCTGAYGDGFGARPGGLTLDELERRPHGIDLGPLQPRVPEVLRTPSGAIELAPPELVADVDRLLRWSSAPDDDGFVLVNRREVRSNNSWLGNVAVLSRGSRCTAQIHPDDAAALGIDDGRTVVIRSRVGEIELPAELTDAVRRGVVCVPHGWGRGGPGSATRVASASPGANVNILTDPERYDALTGTVALTGVPVSVAPAP